MPKNHGYIRKLKRELYLLERSLERTNETLEKIETQFGKKHIAFSVFTKKKDELEKQIKDKEWTIKFHK